MRKPYKMFANTALADKTNIPSEERKAFAYRVKQYGNYVEVENYEELESMHVDLTHWLKANIGEQHKKWDICLITTFRLYEWDHYSNCERVKFQLENAFFFFKNAEDKRLFEQYLVMCFLSTTRVDHSTEEARAMYKMAKITT